LCAAEPLSAARQCFSPRSRIPNQGNLVHCIRPDDPCQQLRGEIVWLTFCRRIVQGRQQLAQTVLLQPRTPWPVGRENAGQPPWRRQAGRRSVPVTTRSTPRLPRIWSSPAARADRARAFRRRTEQPSRRARARPDAGNPCTRRLAGRGQWQRCRGSSVEFGMDLTDRLSPQLGQGYQPT
jgi:hypothetical protein